MKTTRLQWWWPILALAPFFILLPVAAWGLSAARPLLAVDPCLTGWTVPWGLPFGIMFWASVVVMVVVFFIALARGPSGTRIAGWGLVWFGLPLAFVTLVIWAAPYGWHC